MTDAAFDTAKFGEGNGQPWCAFHGCHPKECWEQHNPHHETIQNEQLLLELEDTCEHGVPLSQQCVPCNHVYMQYINGEGE